MSRFLWSIVLCLRSATLFHTYCASWPLKHTQQRSYLGLNCFYQFGETAELFSSASKYCCNNFSWFDCFCRSNSNCNVFSSYLLGYFIIICHQPKPNMINNLKLMSVPSPPSVKTELESSMGFSESSQATTSSPVLDLRGWQGAISIERPIIFITRLLVDLTFLDHWKF